MKLVWLPYHLSVVGQAAARAALRYTDEILARVAELVDERERVAAALRRVGFDVLDSAANFLLFGRFADASVAWQRYLEHDVLLRDMGIFHHLRVSVGAAENDRSIENTELCVGRQLR